MDGRHRSAATPRRDRTRLTGRSPGALFLVRAPDRARGAGVADGPRLVHGAEWQRVLDAAKQARDLDLGAVGTGSDGDVPDAAPPDPTTARNGCPYPRVDWFRSHLRLQPAADR